MCAQIELFAPDLALVCTVSCQLDWIITIMWSELINTHFRIYLCSRNPKLRTLLNYWDNKKSNHYQWIGQPVLHAFGHMGAGFPAFLKLRA